MPEFQFNCLTASNHLMRQANCRHVADIQLAHDRQDARAANRHERELNRAAALDTVLLAAMLIGTAAATALLCTVGAV